jgi:hypothetical protein
MNGKLTTKSKLFWHWEDDKEEAWLTQMAKQGLHLIRPALFGQYTFVDGEPRDVIYRLDFVKSNKKDEAYFQLFRDAGWEHVGEMMGWQYWRKEVKPGETPEIFTDAESKIQKYRRLLGFLGIVSLPIFMAVINMCNYNMVRISALTGWIEWVFAGIWILTIIIFFLYIYIFARLGLRIRQLKRM